MNIRVLSIVLVLSVGCSHQYSPPRAGEPHAVIKFRRSYQESKGTLLIEKLHIGEERAFMFKGKRKVAETTRTDAILVAPGQNLVTAFAEFSSIQSNGDSSYKAVHGKCSQTMPITAEAGGVYLLQLNYQNKNVCTVECYRQTPTENGEFVTARCE